MRILVLSDLHLDSWDRALRDPLPAIAAAAGNIDAVIIAGDLTDNAVQNWPQALARVRRSFPNRPVFILPGNHEYYYGHLHLDRELRRTSESAGAIFVQKAKFILDDIRILTCTLWTDFEINGTRDASMQRAASAMNDYVVIAKSASDPSAIAPHDTIHVHQEHLAWLQMELAHPFDGRTVVITHHGPSPAARGSEHPLAPAFCSDLDQLIQTNSIALWLFGHTHRQITGRAGGIPVVNVSFGYAREVSDEAIHRLVRRSIIDTAVPELLTEI